MAAIIPEAKEEAAVAIVIPPVIGCKLDVWKGNADQTKGGLVKDNLRKNRVGQIVSKNASDAAKRNKNLGDYQFPMK